jgi:predicted peptidase
MVKLATALTLALASASALAQTGQPRVETGFLDRTTQIDGRSFRYQVYIPREYTADRAWPVLLHLHGGGPQGTDGLKHTMRISEQILIDRSRFSVIVVSPQAQPERRWLDPDMQEMAIAELDQTMREFSVDPDRVYLSGFSMGAIGAYGVAYRWPERFAAVVAIAGRVEQTSSGANEDARRANPFVTAVDPFAALAGRIKHLPIWIFQGAEDEGIPVEQPRRLVKALKAAGSSVRYTEYPETNHDESAQKALSEPATMKWLLAQRRPPQTSQ